jgi:cell wall-associated NlpC family hydrolase
MEIRYSKLIGIPYLQLDCWGIAREFYALQYGIELKRYYDEIPQDRDLASNLIYHSKGDFIRIDSPEFGDLILIKLFGVESHIAVYLGGGKILHTSKNHGCHIDSLAKWQKLVTSYYRVIHD